MTFKEWMIKNFKRKNAVIINVLDEAGHYTTHWSIPERDNVVKIDGLEKAVVISRETMMLSTKWNIPTFLVHHTNCECIQVDNLRETFYSADEFRMILDNDEAHKIFSSSNKGKLSNETVMILAVIILGFLGMFYFFNTKLGEIDEKVSPAIVEVIDEDTIIENVGE